VLLFKGTLSSLIIPEQFKLINAYIAVSASPCSYHVDDRLIVSAL